MNIMRDFLKVISLSFIIMVYRIVESLPMMVSFTVLLSVMAMDTDDGEFSQEVHKIFVFVEIKIEFEGGPNLIENV